MACNHLASWAARSLPSQEENRRSAFMVTIEARTLGGNIDHLPDSTFVGAMRSPLEITAVASGPERREYVRFLHKSKCYDEIRLFGRLADKCLADTPLSFPRDPDALVESLDPLGRLLRAVHRQAIGRFDTIETNFVWDENLASSRLNLRHFGAPHRRSRVHFREVLP